MRVRKRSAVLLAFVLFFSCALPLGSAAGQSENMAGAAGSNEMQAAAQDTGGTEQAAAIGTAGAAAEPAAKEVSLAEGQYVRLGDMDWIVTDVSDRTAARLMTADCVAAMPYGDTNNLWNTSRVCEYLNGEFLNRFTERERALLQTAEWSTGVDGGSATESGAYTAVIPSKSEMENAAAHLGPEIRRTTQNYWVRTRVSGDSGRGMLALADGSGYTTLPVNTRGARWSDAGVRPVVILKGAVIQASGSGTAADPYLPENVAEVSTPTYRLTVETGAELFGARETDEYDRKAYDLKLKLVGAQGESQWFTINPFGSGDGRPGAGSQKTYEIALQNVGRVEQIKYMAAGNADEADWYISRITAWRLDEKGGVLGDAETFEVHQWVLNSYEGVISLGSRYTVSIKTGNIRGAGTDSNIYVRLIGADGKMTDEVRLNKLISGNAFEQNRTDTVTASFNCDVGTVDEIQVRSDMKWLAADWYVDWIKVRQEGSKIETTFTVGEWIADKNTRIYTTSPKKSTQYKLTVNTGDELGAGTDSMVYVKLIGTNGETAEREISELYNGNAFERDTSHAVIANFDKNVGTIKKIMVRSDMGWAAADWLLSSIKAEPIVNGEVMPGEEFTINEWINDKNWRTYSNDPADSTQYRFIVKTGTAAGAGTDSMIYVKLVGSRGETAEREISELYNGNAFERNTTHTVTAAFDKNIGEVKQIKVRSDMSWPGAQWLLSSIQVDPVYNGQVQSGGKTFQIQEWITDKNWHTFSADSEAITQYRFRVKTGKLSWYPKGEGTDSMIYVKLTGDRGTTNEMEISELVSGNAFERGNTDTLHVTFENAVGNLRSIKLRSDHKWPGADWYVEWIEVQPLLNGSPYGSAKTFYFNQWIDDTSTYEKW